MHYRQYRGYPLMLHYESVRQVTTSRNPTRIPGQGPFNRFSYGKAFPPADFKQIVRANVDTLYSVVSLDLGPEQVVLSAPATEPLFHVADADSLDRRVGRAGHLHRRTQHRARLPRRQSQLGQVPAGLDVNPQPYALRYHHRPHADERAARGPQISVR